MVGAIRRRPAQDSAAPPPVYAPHAEAGLARDAEVARIATMALDSVTMKTRLVGGGRGAIWVVTEHLCSGGNLNQEQKMEQDNGEDMLRWKSQPDEIHRLAAQLV